MKNKEKIKTIRDFLQENCDTFSTEHSLIKGSDDYNIVNAALEYAKQEKQITIDSFTYHDKIKDDILKWIAACPFNIDEATVSKKGIDAAPEQVVVNVSLSYVIWKQLQDMVKNSLKK